MAARTGAQADLRRRRSYTSGVTRSYQIRTALVHQSRCAPQKVEPALIARFGPAMLGCFVPVDPTTPPARLGTWGGSLMRLFSNIWLIVLAPPSRSLARPRRTSSLSLNLAAMVTLAAGALVRPSMR